jgi:hypothetical protein
LGYAMLVVADSGIMALRQEPEPQYSETSASGCDTMVMNHTRLPARDQNVSQ